MGKYIRVTMPDGSQWDVNAAAIASHRAERYANTKYAATIHDLNEQTREFNRVYWETYRNDALLLHLARDIFWSDVADSAVPVLPMTTEEEKIQGWEHGQKFVVELPDDHYDKAFRR